MKIRLRDAVSCGGEFTQPSLQLSAEYTEAKVDVTQEIEQGAQQAAQAGADHCALYSILCVQILRRTRYITPDLSWGRKSKGLMM